MIQLFKNIGGRISAQANKVEYTESASGDHTLASEACLVASKKAPGQGLRHFIDLCVELVQLGDYEVCQDEVPQPATAILSSHTATASRPQLLFVLPRYGSLEAQQGALRMRRSFEWGEYPCSPVHKSAYGEVGGTRNFSGEVQLFPCCCSATWI